MQYFPNVWKYRVEGNNKRNTFVTSRLFIAKGIHPRNPSCSLNFLLDKIPVIAPTNKIIAQFPSSFLILSNVTPAPTQQSRDGCNCRKKNECPLEGQCLQTNVVYQATVTSEASTESYVGLATNFKERYRNHNASFRHSNKRNETELSKHIWTLKDAKKAFQIKWKVLKKCQPYNNISKKCNLCLHEKFIIICKKDLCSLNKRNELASSCPHRNRFVLKNLKVT